MSTNHDHLHRLVETKEAEAVRNPIQEFRFLAGIESSLSSLEEAISSSKALEKDLDETGEWGDIPSAPWPPKPQRLSGSTPIKKGLKDEYEDSIAMIRGNPTLQKKLRKMLADAKTLEDLKPIFKVLVKLGMVTGDVEEDLDEALPSGVTLKQKPGEKYWFVMRGGAKIGSVSLHKKGPKYDADAGEEYKGGFPSPEKAAAWVAQQHGVSEDVDRDVFEQKLWVKKAIKKPDRLRRYFGVKKGEKIPMKKLVAAYRKLKAKEDKSDDEISLMRAMALGIRLKGGDVPGGEQKRGLRGESAEKRNKKYLSEEQLRYRVLAGINTLSRR